MMTETAKDSTTPAAGASPDASPLVDAATIVAQWQAIDARIRERVRYGRVGPAELARTDGLGFMQRMLAGELPGPPILQTLDFMLVHVERGEAVFQGTPGPAHYNPIGSVHGGYIATLLDSAVGCAVHSALAQGLGYTTLELKVNYLRPVTDQTGPLRAIGKVISLTRQVGLAHGDLVDAAGKLYAHATTTCLVFPLPGGAPAPQRETAGT